MVAKTKSKKAISRLKKILKHRFFWILTVFGTVFFLLGGALLWIFESPLNPKLQFLDYVLWSAGIVTTIGYGDYMAITTFGKFIVLTLMLVGTIFVWTYMAFLVAGLIAPEISSLEREVEDVEKEIKEIKIKELKETSN